MVRKCTTCGTPPIPYYKENKNNVTQDHASIFRDTQFAAGIKIIPQFVVPQLGEDIQVSAENIINVVVGTYIWSPEYGYLKISEWNSTTKKIGLLNEDITGNAVPGTVVSALSLWAVTARPCCADQDTFSIFPFLAEDYVIPAVSGSVTLDVTSTFGLITNTNVRIGSNIYFLTTINSSLQIVVVNNGAGGTPGDTVEARDANDDLQYLITSALVSACSSAGASSVKLLGCDGSNEAILEGQWIGQVPSLIDPATEEVEFKLLDTDVRVCTELLTAVNVQVGVFNYTIEVADETIFNIGDILQLNFGTLRWEVTDNTTPGELDITCTATSGPVSNFTIPSGTPVCRRFTTEDLQEEVDVLDEAINNLIYEGGWVSPTNIGTGTYISASSFKVSGDFTSYLKIGQKLRFVNSTLKYANIESFSYAALFTTINIIVNSDYTIANTSITSIAIANNNPPDFPAVFNYDCSPTGYSSNTSIAMYSIAENLVNISGVVVGVSNSTSLTFNLPVNREMVASTPNAHIGFASDIVNNGSSTGAIGAIIHPGASKSCSVYRDQSFTGWTNSGDKAFQFSLTYVIKQ